MKKNLFHFVLRLIACFIGEIVSKSSTKGRGADCIGEDCLSKSV